jgi:ABC-type phosphate transport system permease subunit
VDGSAAVLISMVLLFNLGARFVGRLLTRRMTAS